MRFPQADLMAVSPAHSMQTTFTALRARRRLRQVAAAVVGGGSSVAAAADIHTIDIPDPNSRGVNFTLQPDCVPNSPLGKDVQGYRGQKPYGKHPPPFDPAVQPDEAFDFYCEHGFVVISALSASEVAKLNTVADNFHKYNEAGEILGPAELFFPMLEYPEFDFTFFHPKTLPLVERILGGREVPRVIEFNYRAWNGPESGYNMAWHPDDCSGGLLTLEQRQTRMPYGPPDMLSTFTYLSDVDETTPSFGVVPKSRRADNIQVLSQMMGDSYCEVPIYGPAGTCCVVDRSTIHTRLDPLVTDHSRQKSRRLYHHVFARAGRLEDANGVLRTGNGEPLTDAPPRSLAPRRLVESKDPDVARMFSVLSKTQKEWMKTGYNNDFLQQFKSAWGGL